MGLALQPIRVWVTLELSSNQEKKLSDINITDGTALSNTRFKCPD